MSKLLRMVNTLAQKLMIIEFILKISRKMPVDVELRLKQLISQYDTGNMKGMFVGG